MKSTNRPSKSKLRQPDAKPSGKISSKIIERAAALSRAAEAAEAERAAKEIATLMAAEAAEEARIAAQATEAARVEHEEALRRSAEQAESLRRREILVPRKTAFDPNPTLAVRAKLLEEGIVPLSNAPLLDTPETVQISGRSRRPSIVAMPRANRTAAPSTPQPAQSTPQPAQSTPQPARLPVREIQIAASQLLATVEPDCYIPEPVLAPVGESKLRKINYENASDPAPLAYPSQTLAQRIEAQLA